MLAFIRRSRHSLEVHGLGEVPSSDSQRLIRVFAECERHLRTITDKMTSDTQQQVVMRASLLRHAAAWRQTAAQLAFSV